MRGDRPRAKEILGLPQTASFRDVLDIGQALMQQVPQPSNPSGPVYWLGEVMGKEKANIRSFEKSVWEKLVYHLVKRPLAGFRQGRWLAGVRAEMEGASEMPVQGLWQSHPFAYSMPREYVSRERYIALSDAMWGLKGFSLSSAFNRKAAEARDRALAESRDYSAAAREGMTVRPADGSFKPF